MEIKSLDLIVKSPNDRVPVQTISCPITWTVEQLKVHLSECYPTNPSPSSQRLIHAGKLLKDDSILESIFRDMPGVQTVHLVCRNSKSAPGQSSKPTTSSRENPSTEANNVPPEELADYQRRYYEYLQQYYLANGDRSSMTNAHPQAAYPYFSFQNPWHMAYAGYQPTGQPMGYYPPWPPVSQPEQSAAPANTDNDPAVAQDNQWFRGARAFLADLGVVNDLPAGGEAAAANPPAGQQQAMMVGNPMGGGGFMGAEEMGENGANMDIVDRFYMLFRLCLFIGLCFAYSSLDKAIIVFSVAAYVYFYNIYRRHAAVRQAAAQAQPAAPVVEAPQTDIQPQMNSTDTEIRHRETEQEVVDAQPPQPDHRLTRLTGTLRLVVNTSYQFVSSLLTSLIPEQPPPIRLD